MVSIKPGTRLRSVVSEVEVIVVKATSTDVDLTCGGQPMVALDDPRPPEEAAADGAVLLGKRYVDEASGVELLCTKSGAGELAIGGQALAIQGAKPLPSSD